MARVKEDSKIEQIEVSEVRRWEDETYLGFCCWRGRLAKEVGRRAMAREASLLGGWLGSGLPSWGKVKTHLNWVNPF